MSLNEGKLNKFNFNTTEEKKMMNEKSLRRTLKIDSREKAMKYAEVCM